MISQGLTRPVRKNFAKHCESRTAEVAAKPEITRHSPQLFFSKRPNKSPTVPLSKGGTPLFRELVFQPYIPFISESMFSPTFKTGLCDLSKALLQ